MNMQELEEKANQKLDEAEQALRTIDNMEFGDEQEQEKKSKKEVSLYHEIKNLRDTNVEEADFKDENESIGSERDYQKEGDIEELIDDLEFKDKDQMNRTILHKVSLDQNFAILKMHLSKIQSFKLHLKRNKEKKRVLQPRDEKINIRIDQLLEAKDENGNTALMLACVHAIESKKESKHDCIKLLLESGNNPNIMNKETGFTPLHWVARYGELQNVEILCEAGAKAYMVDSKGFTPIDYAGKFEHNSTIKYLIDLISR
jgi:ankyrin repeat protein